MSKITKLWSLVALIMLTASFAFGQAGQNDVQDMEQNVSQVFVPQSDFDYTKLVNSDADRSVLWDNGGFITEPGGGSGGSDYSALQDASLGMSTYGFGCQLNSTNSIADDFEVTGTWTVNTITFFAYQTGSGPQSTLNHVAVQIWDGDPTAGGSVIWGDLSTNIMSTTEWTNVWRVLESSPSENRPIMEIVADIGGLSLTPGTYWYEANFSGTGSSGPWAPPITILGETTTGNAKQNQSGSWVEVVDGGTLTPQGFPFIIEGSSGNGGDPPTDLVIDFVEPDCLDLSWTAPGGGSGELVELTQHDNNNQNGYYQNYDYGYGVVFDISAYPGCTIEFMDFRHSSWGITGTWDYTIHVVDWDTYTEVYETPVFQSTCNDCWEEEVDLGSLAGESGLVGIFLEPMGNDPADAYPCLDSDDVGPDGMSYFGALPDYSGFGISGIGDFLLDLWIMTAGEKQLVQAPKFVVQNPQTTNARKQANPVEGTFELNQTENTRDLNGYNVYRDGSLVDYTTATNYSDCGLDPGTYMYCITAVYDDGESECLEGEGTVPASNLDPPTNLVATYVEPDDIELTWDSPFGPPVEEWIHWDDGVNADAIGLTSGGTFYIASHWDPADLTPYNGAYITKLTFFAGDYAGSTYTLKVWTGPNASTEVMSQAVPSYTQGAWNEFDLSSSVMIDASQELWFGYEVSHGASTFPAGCDAGPALQGYGDMISLNGSSWESMGGAYGLDYNWNMQAWVTNDADGPIATPLVKSIIENPATPEFTVVPQHTENPVFNPSTKDFLGYNLYRDGSFLVYVEDESYMDENLSAGTYCYEVTAVYDEGESGPSNEDCAEVPGGANFPFEDDFDAHTSGDQLVCQGAFGWTTWSDNPCSGEDPYVTSDEYYTAMNSVVIEGSNDLVHPIDNYTSDDHEITFNIYVPDGYTGYFNTLSLFAGASSNWAMQAYFDLDGFGLVDAGGAGTGSFFYDNDSWVSVKVRANLDDDEGTMWVNGTEVVQWIWSTGAFGDDDLLQIGGSNFYAWNVNGTPLFYIDDYRHDFFVGTNEPIHVESFTKVYPNPANNVVNIAADSDILSVEVINFAGQMIIKEFTDTKFHTISVEDMDTGVYIFRVETENGVTNQRIIIE